MPSFRYILLAAVVISGVHLFTRFFPFNENVIAWRTESPIRGNRHRHGTDDVHFEIQNSREGGRDWLGEDVVAPVIALDTSLTSQAPVASSKPVQVEVFMMSKCPDTNYSISHLILPLMANLSDSGVIELKPTFIGTIDESNGGVSCKHGPPECLGNMVELCAYNLYKSNPKIWLGFISCLSAEYPNIPDDEFIHGCAKDYGLDFQKLDNCVSGDDEDAGIALLRDSVQRADQLGVSTSFTIHVNGETRCVRDADSWKDCDGGHEVSDLRRDILKAYDDEK